MEEAYFRDTRGTLKRATLQGRSYTYFVPPPLPRTIEYTPELVEALSRADTLLGRLSSLSDFIPNPRLLIAPYLRKEAVLSSRIEGTQASLSDVFLEEAAGAGTEQAGDVGEVVNYIRALDRGITRLEEGTTLDLALLRELHEVLMTNVRGHERSPGYFRTEQNWIGPSGSPLAMATYVPPAPADLPACLEDLERYLDDPPSLPNLIQVALIHYQFEAIHPFRDGNGRIGRLLIILWLLQRGVLSAPLLYLSAYFERNRQQYYEHLMHASESGSYTAWLCFFLDGVASESEDALERAKSLVSLRERYRETLQSRNATAGMLTLLDQLFANPYVTITDAARRLDVTFPTAQRAVEALEEAGILREITGQARFKRYRADEILQAIEV